MNQERLNAHRAAMVREFNPERFATSPLASFPKFIMDPYMSQFYTDGSPVMPGNIKRLPTEYSLRYKGTQSDLRDLMSFHGRELDPLELVWKQKQLICPATRKVEEHSHAASIIRKWKSEELAPDLRHTYSSYALPDEGVNTFLALELVSNEHFLQQFSSFGEFSQKMVSQGLPVDALDLQNGFVNLVAHKTAVKFIQWGALSEEDLHITYSRATDWLMDIYDFMLQGEKKMLMISPYPFKADLISKGRYPHIDFVPHFLTAMMTSMIGLPYRIPSGDAYDMQVLGNQFKDLCTCVTKVVNAIYGLDINSAKQGYSFKKVFTEAAKQFPKLSRFIDFMDSADKNFLAIGNYYRIHPGLLNKKSKYEQTQADIMSEKQIVDAIITAGGRPSISASIRRKRLNTDVL